MELSACEFGFVSEFARRSAWRTKATWSKDGSGRMARQYELQMWEFTAAGLDPEPREFRTKVVGVGVDGDERDAGRLGVEIRE